MSVFDWIVIVVLPVIWSALCEAARLSAGVPDDRRDKRLLALMLAPIALGIGLVAASHALPVARVSGLPHMLTPPIFTSQAFVPLAAPGANAPATVDWCLWLTVACAVSYLSGLIATAAPLVTGLIQLARLAATAQPVEIACGRVWISDSDVPPLAWGRDRVVLPRMLYERLSPAELALIVAHERAHLTRRDTLWFPALSLIDAVLWFNPFVRRQTGRCRIAAELACDAAVTTAQPAVREAYAELILRVLRWGGEVTDVVPAANAGDYRLRLEHILRAPQGRSRSGRWLFAGLIAAVVPLALVQFAWAQPAAKTAFTGLWAGEMLAEQDKARADQEASDPATLHRRLAAEPRDEAWASGEEQALQAQLQRFHPAAEITRMTPVVYCGSTLCEIDMRISFDKAADNFALARAGNALTSFLNHLSSEVPGFENGGTSSVMTPSPDGGRHADIIAVNIYTRKGATAAP